MTITHRPPKAEQIILAYIRQCIEDGMCEITFQQISDATTYSDRMIRNVVYKYRRQGIIHAQQTRGGRPLRYALPD
jgi:hypothetical protein